MNDLMESQNLVLQAPMQAPVDKVASAHACVLVAIQQDTLGEFTVEEKGKLVAYILTNAAAAAAYKHISDDDICNSWLCSAALS